MEKAISQIYQKKEKLVIIGLTGRTGAGCSTVANILKKKIFENLDSFQQNVYSLFTAAQILRCSTSGFFLGLFGSCFIMKLCKLIAGQILRNPAKQPILAKNNRFLVYKNRSIL